MATVRHTGNASPVKQVDTCVVGGTIDALNTFTVTINGRAVTVAAGSTSAATVATTIVATLTISKIPELTEQDYATTSGGSYTATSKVAGRPFTLSVSKAQAGGASNTHTHTSSTTTANSGPNDASLAANYSTAALPAAGDDLVYEDLVAANMPLWNLTALSAIALNSVTFRRCAGETGLDRWNVSGYEEYRSQFLKLVLQGDKTILVEDCTAGLIKLDLNSNTAYVTVSGTGIPTEPGCSAVQVKGLGMGSTLAVRKGSVDIAWRAGETAILAGTVAVGYDTTPDADAVVRFGGGVAFNSATLRMVGGAVTLRSNIATVTKRAGTLTVLDGATIGTWTEDGGVSYEQSSGTKATVNIGPSGKIECNSGVSRAWSAVTIQGGGELVDRAQTIAPVAIQLSHCGLFPADPKGAKVDFGTNYTLTRG